MLVTRFPGPLRGYGALCGSADLVDGRHADFIEGPFLERRQHMRVGGVVVYHTVQGLVVAAAAVSDVVAARVAVPLRLLEGLDEKQLHLFCMYKTILLMMLCM